MDDEYLDGGQRRSILAVFLIVVFLYVLLLGFQGIATDIVIDGNLAYVMVGRYGGVRILDISNPIEPRELGYYDTPGTAQKAALVGKRLFVADGDAGMRIFDVSDPSMPVLISAVDAGVRVRSVAVAGSFAYLSAGRDGVVVVDVSNHARPIVLSRVDTPGAAHSAAPAQVFAAPPGVLPGTPEFEQQATLQAVFLYVADGSRGLQVVDVTVPTNPRLAGEFNTEGTSVDVKVVNTYAFVADGSTGVQVFDLRQPLQPQRITQIDTPGYAHSLSLSGVRLYVADGERGVRVYDVSDPAAPGEINRYENLAGVEGVSVKGTFAYAAAGFEGVKVIDFNDSVQAHIAGFYETPGDANIGQIIEGGYHLVRGSLSDVQPKVGSTLLKMLFDLVLFIFLVLFWLVFYAQFILPVRRLSERRAAASRLAAYHLGVWGPAIFIENGQVRERRAEKERAGPGVAIVDTASAAVLRTEHSFTRAVGPGIVFLRRREYPAGVVDLHRQVCTIGPEEHEDPYAPQQNGESPPIFEQRQSRRYQTSGLTRDGVEVTPNITAVFSLNAQPGEGGTQFGYNPSAVWRAITREGVDPHADPGADRRRISWSFLPAYVAADLWREYLRKFTLDELFTFTIEDRSRFIVPADDEADTIAEEEELPQPSPNGGGELKRGTAFDQIVSSIRERLTQPEYEELDEFGRKTGLRKPSKEYELLQDRGVKIIGVGVRNLHFPPDVENRLVGQWEASWLERAKEESRQVEVVHAQKRIEGQDMAQKGFASASSQLLGSELKTERDINLKESLRLLLQGTLRLLVREAELAPRLTNQKTVLVELIEWIGKQ